MSIHTMIAVDWSARPEKRAAFRADLGTGLVTPLAMSGGLHWEALFDAAAEAGPTLLAIDVAIGVPAALVEARADGVHRRAGFLDWLRSRAADETFWQATADPRLWSPRRPFIQVPPGRGSLTRFQQAAGCDLRREVDRRFVAKSPLIVSGIPGSVGSASRSFWRFLAAQLDRPERPFRVWPFEGSLESLASEAQVIVAEAYPALAYAVTLAADWPTPQLLVAKTSPAIRRAFLEEVGRQPWGRCLEVVSEGRAQALASEDAFDALVTALAGTRLSRAQQPLGEATGKACGFEGNLLFAPSITNLGTRRRYRNPK